MAARRRREAAPVRCACWGRVARLAKRVTRPLQRRRALGVHPRKAWRAWRDSCRLSCSPSSGCSPPTMAGGQPGEPAYLVKWTGFRDRKQVGLRAPACGLGSAGAAAVMAAAGLPAARGTAAAGCQGPGGTAASDGAQPPRRVPQPPTLRRRLPAACRCRLCCRTSTGPAPSSPSPTCCSSGASCSCPGCAAAKQQEQQPAGRRPRLASRRTHARTRVQPPRPAVRAPLALPAAGGGRGVAGAAGGPGGGRHPGRQPRGGGGRR